MTESKQALNLVRCLCSALITCACYLASTGGDTALALVLLAIGYIPVITDVTRELQLDPGKRIFVGIVCTLAVPAFAVLTYNATDKLKADNAWLCPALHYVGIGLTGMIGVSTLIILTFVLVEVTKDWSKSSLRASVV